MITFEICTDMMYMNVDTNMKFFLIKHRQDDG